MAKYDGWTLGETEALLNLVGGVDVARAVLRGERKLTVEVAPQSESPVRPPLVGRAVQTLTIPAYKVKDFADAVRLGKFDNDTAEIVCRFGKEQVGLIKPVKIDLVKFDRAWWKDEAIAWGKDNGNKKSIGGAHLLGIAIKLPDEQRERPIVELGSVQGGLVLCLCGRSDWRGLYRSTVEGLWYRSYLVGFVSEPA